MNTLRLGLTGTVPATRKTVATPSRLIATGPPCDGTSWSSRRSPGPLRPIPKPTWDWDDTAIAACPSQPKTPPNLAAKTDLLRVWSLGSFRGTSTLAPGCPRTRSERRIVAAARARAPLLGPREHWVEKIYVQGAKGIISSAGRSHSSLRERWPMSRKSGTGPISRGTERNPPTTKAEH